MEKSVKIQLMVATIGLIGLIFASIVTGVFGLLDNKEVIEVRDSSSESMAATIDSLSTTLTVVSRTSQALTPDSIPTIATPTMQTTPRTPIEASRLPPVDQSSYPALIPDWTNQGVSQLSIEIPEGYDWVYVSLDPAIINGISVNTGTLVITASKLIVESLTFNASNGHFNISAAAYDGLSPTELLGIRGLDGKKRILVLDSQGKLISDFSASDAILPTADFQTMIDESSSPNDLIDKLDTYWESNPDAGGWWQSPGQIVIGPAVFWTDIFDNSRSLPDGVSMVKGQGGWGVYSVANGEIYEIQKPNQGGRYLRLSKD